MKSSIIKIDAHVYPAQLCVGYGAPKDQMRRYMQRKGCNKDAIDALFEPDTVGKLVVDTKTQCIYIWIPKRNIPVLVHELTHATFFILDACGIKISCKNDEVFCYLLEHLLVQVLES